MSNLQKSKFLRFWFPAILYSGIIFYASSVPGLTTPMPEIHFDKILHVLEYLPFGFLIARAINNTKASIPHGIFFGMVLLITFLFGIGDEIHQSFVPGRNADIVDALAGTVGGFIGGYFYLFWLKRTTD